MPVWQTASVAFFAYVLVVVVWRWRWPARRRAGLIAAVGAAAGILTTLATLTAPVARQPLLVDWVLPPSVLLIAYWSSGLLFVAPNERQEKILIGLDARLGILEIARRTPRGLAEILEVSYVGIYPLIPAALALHLLFAPHPDATRFWSVILVTDFICFAFLPCVQTRPPRALESDEPWLSSIRRFNLQLVGATSVQVNTFPSGHAAEALAAALLLLGTGPIVTIAMLAAALAVSAGAVFGRYHYAADALAGWAVAVAVWAVLR
jgi:membrane-associated phospholipid phosphatase